MDYKKNIASILELLQARRTRATYSAVAGILGCDPRQVGRILGVRRPEASWVVNATTGLPTGYKPHELHRELQINPRVIADAAELAVFLEQNRDRGFGMGGAVRDSVDDIVVEQSLRDGDRFEMMVAEIYRELGYRVLERGGRRPDGGVDLEVSKDGKRTLVQCKFRKRDAIGVKVARELLGVMHHEGAHGAVLVSPVGFTVEARRFASANGMELVDGEGIRRMLTQTGVDGERLMKKVRRSGVAPSVRTMVSRVALFLLFLAVGVVAIKMTADHVISSLSTGNLATLRSNGSAKPKVRAEVPSPVVVSTEKATANQAATGGELQEDELRSGEARFEQWYKPPAECIASSTNPSPDLVACGNHRIRARRVFESQE